MQSKKLRDDRVLECLKEEQRSIVQEIRWWCSLKKTEASPEIAQSFNPWHDADKSSDNGANILFCGGRLIS
jgi:prepilin-type processing-associated H-X9-DG protein